MALDSAPHRPRNAAATRAAILEAACIAFTRAGYDGVGVREIAAEAGVTAMLVNRYFGSKDGLFAEVVETVLSDPRSLLSRSGIFAKTAAHQVLDAGAVDPLLLVLRSAVNPRGAALLRPALERHIAKPLAGRLEGPDADIRAGLILAVLAGASFMLTAAALPAFREAGSAQLVDRVAGLLKSLADPDSP